MALSQISGRYRVRQIDPGVHPPPPLTRGPSPRQSRANLCRGRAALSPVASTPRASTTSVPVCVSDSVELFRVNTPSPVRCVPSIRIARLSVVCKWICLFMGIIVVPGGLSIISLLDVVFNINTTSVTYRYQWSTDSRFCVYTVLARLFPCLEVLIGILLAFVWILMDEYYCFLL